MAVEPTDEDSVLLLLEAAREEASHDGDQQTQADIERALATRREGTDGD